MDPKELQKELIAVFGKYDVHLALFSFAYTDEKGNIATYSNCLCHIPPRDHEEQLLRDTAAKELHDICSKTLKNIYGGR
jgi:hypothetical protein